MQGSGSIDIAPTNLHITEIHHLPTVLTIPFGNSYNLILNLIEISVGFYTEGTEGTLCPCFVVLDTAIILSRIFRQEGNVAHIGIIEIIKSRHTEYTLIESPKIQLFFEVRLITEKDSWCELRTMFGGCWHGLGWLMNLIHHKCTQYACLRFDIFPIHLCCSGYKHRISFWEHKICEVSI